MSGLTHIDAEGAAHMVDVSNKDVTAREAVAKGRISMSAEAAAAIRDGSAKKGDVIAVARVAGIMAAKRTSDLIPLCHPLPISSVSIDLAPDASGVNATATVRTTGRTGVEMEAMTAVSVALLTIYDMVKAVDKAMEIGAVRLISKTGGKSGDYKA
ncbi:cyclic pyranopterin monophosphate synthase MoaC [Sphingomonas colocasiae]|uniref:Cyclic pyranopterin monophosphate synthase n=1 Tax=Sphingomonas colocasiae TaxID=1848973 RepID=A0ABS7PNS2_9SPHN|nr:cyclic pyranopterin monophosphate synthase MoaC [Sphingomonas colocasiae]MBY8822971.1 cyclic pyranopterin monophosphate synthase MoaC [Sphingomonas colocasiae]